MAMHIDQVMHTGVKSPTVVFVHGAWHSPEFYAPLLDGLRKTKFHVIAPHLPSAGGSSDNFNDDVLLVRRSIASQVNDGHEVVVVMHSYGGMVGSAAVEGLSKHDVRTGGGVIRLIYLTAFALEAGVSLMDSLNNQPLPWQKSVNEKQWDVINPQQVFYNDVECEVADELAAKLLLQSKGSLESKQTYAAWKYIDSTYVVCENDMAIPKHAQLSMASQAGGRFTIEYLAAGHSPFLSMPQQTVHVIRKTIWESG
jgi:pimeloyl-ACP methyl ester carboxylesterase